MFVFREAVDKFLKLKADLLCFAADVNVREYSEIFGCTMAVDASIALLHFEQTSNELHVMVSCDSSTGIFCNSAMLLVVRRAVEIVQNYLKSSEFSEIDYLRSFNLMPVVFSNKLERLQSQVDSARFKVSILGCFGTPMKIGVVTRFV